MGKEDIDIDREENYAFDPEMLKDPDFCGLLGAVNRGDVAAVEPLADWLEERGYPAASRNVREVTVERCSGCGRPPVKRLEVGCLEEAYLRCECGHRWFVPAGAREICRHALDVVMWGKFPARDLNQST